MYAPGVPPAPAAGQPGRRRTGLLITGLVLLLAGLGGAIAAVLVAGSRVDDAVTRLARAPVGCTTTLEVDSPGTFNVFVETKGTLPDDGSGDCAAASSYDRADDDLPEVQLTLVDGDEDEVDITSDSGVDYDAAGFVGSQVGTVVVDEAGTYRLTVVSDDTDFAIAVGKDPEGDQASLTTIGLAAGGAAAVIGLVLALLGLRRRPPAAGAPGVPPANWSTQPPSPTVPGFTPGPPTSTDLWAPTRPAPAPTVPLPTMPPATAPIPPPIDPGLIAPPPSPPTGAPPSPDTGEAPPPPWGAPHV